MAVRPITTIPNTVLYEKTERVRQIDQPVLDVAKDLVDSVSKRMCVVRNFFKDPQNLDQILSEDIVLINPKIVSRSKETEIDWEGCLSVPDVYGKVERFQKVKVSALGVDGKDIKLKANGFLARTIQHEIDHLDGILFTEKVIGQTITEEELDKIA
jgi:peptide deformylase